MPLKDTIREQGKRDEDAAREAVVALGVNEADIHNIRSLRTIVEVTLSYSENADLVIYYYPVQEKFTYHKASMWGGMPNTESRVESLRDLSLSDWRPCYCEVGKEVE